MLRSLAHSLQAAVDEWLQTGKHFHAMMDHPYHDEAIMGGTPPPPSRRRFSSTLVDPPSLSGMWGARRSHFSLSFNQTFHDFVAAHNAENEFYADQSYLASVVSPIVRQVCTFSGPMLSRA